MFANRFHVSMALTACTLMSSAVLAEKQIVEVPGVSSVRLYANYTFQDCCDLDSISNGESTIFVGTCETMGGYCVSGKKVAVWNFELPSFPENATLLSATFDGRHNGGSTAFGFKGRWVGDSGLGYGAASMTWSYPDFSGNAPSSGGYFSAPLNIDLVGGQFLDNYLILTGYWGSGLTFYNSGTTAPKLRLIVDIPDELCEGDVDGDQTVGVDDLLAILGMFGNACQPPCNEDITGDGLVNVDDVLSVIGLWGSNCESPGACCLPDGTCASTDAAGCEEAGGTWNGSGTYCNFVDCPEYGACCWEDYTCTVMLSDECKASGGSFRGQDTDCDTTNCTIAEYNDECQDAMPAGNGSISISTLKATTSTDPYSDAQCTGTYLGAMNADIWFSYESTCNGTLTVSTCDTVTFDTDLVVYQGTCADMTQIACNGDSTCTGYTSYLETPITAGNTYLIRLGGWDANSAGTGTLLIECSSDE
ncbi:MAG: hypothetical protein MK089_03690 [Phycisphaerales bacterium]|nr:hypothetical protein [Phycisphaerales bacterium]